MAKKNIKLFFEKDVIITINDILDEDDAYLIKWLISNVTKRPILEVVDNEQE